MLKKKKPQKQIKEPFIQPDNDEYCVFGQENAGQMNTKTPSNVTYANLSKVFDDKFIRNQSFNEHEGGNADQASNPQEKQPSDFEVIAANIFDHLDRDSDQTLALYPEQNKQSNDSQDEIEIEELKNLIKENFVEVNSNNSIQAEDMDSNFEDKFDTMKKRYKKNNFITLENFLEEMNKFQGDVDFGKIETKLYERRSGCSGICSSRFCYFKTCCMKVRRHFRRSRLTDLMNRKQQKQVQRGLLDYIGFIWMHLSSGYAIFSDIALGIVCYNFARDFRELFSIEQQYKFSILSSIIFFSVLSPYCLYYSSYMKLLLFNDSYDKHRFNSLPLMTRICLVFNLTFIGSIQFILFDLIAKFLAIVLAITLVTTGWCYGIKKLDTIFSWYEQIMFFIFDLSAQNLKSFDMQKKIVIPMFTNVPMLILQLTIHFNWLGTDGFKEHILQDQSYYVVIRSLVLSIVIFVISLLTLKARANDYQEQSFIIYLLQCMRAQQGWVPFAYQIKTGQLRKNLNFSKIVTKLPYLGWLTDMTGIYGEEEYTFTDFTLEKLANNIETSKNNRKVNEIVEQNNHILSFYSSLNSSSLNGFLHFVESIDDHAIQLSLQDIDWRQLLKISKAYRLVYPITKKDNDSDMQQNYELSSDIYFNSHDYQGIKWYGESISGVSFLQICAKNETRVTQPTGDALLNWNLKECMETLLQENFQGEIFEFENKITLLNYCMRERKFQAMKVLLKYVDVNVRNKDKSTTLGSAILDWQERKQKLVQIEKHNAQESNSKVYEEHKRENPIILEGIRILFEEDRQVDSHSNQIYAFQQPDDKERKLMSPLFYCILNEQNDIKSLLQETNIDGYRLSDDDDQREHQERELLLLLPRMNSQYYSQYFKEDLIEFYKKIDLWELRMQNEGNMMHIIFEEFSFYLKDQGKNDHQIEENVVENLYKDIKTYTKVNTKSQEQFETSILDLIREENNKGVTPLDQLIQTMTNTKGSQIIKRKRILWVQNWLKFILKNSNDSQKKGINDKLWNKYKILFIQKDKADFKMSDEMIQQLYDVNNEPLSEYKRLMRAAFQNKNEEMPVFQYFLQVEQYHQNDGIKNFMLRFSTIIPSNSAEQLIREIQIFHQSGQDKLDDKQNDDIQIHELFTDYSIKPSILTELLLTLVIELLSTIDFVADIIIMKNMIETSHIAWFSISIFLTLCPFLMSYGSFISLKIDNNRQELLKSENKKERCKCLHDFGYYFMQFCYMTPFVLPILLVMDVIYLALTCIILLPCLILKVFQFDSISWFNYLMNKVLWGAFSIPKEQVIGFRRQRTVLQLVYETIPQLILHIYIVYFFEYGNHYLPDHQYQNFGCNLNTLTISIGTAVIHFIVELIMLYFEAQAIDTYFMKYLAVCYNARQGWIPFQSYFKSNHQMRNQKEIMIKFEGNQTTMCSQIEYPFEFEFSDSLVDLLIKRVSNLDKIPNRDKRINMQIGSSFNMVDIKNVIQLIKVSYQRLNIQITDLDIANLRGLPEYVKEIQEPEFSFNDDFLQVVKTSGCHKMLEFMLSQNAKFSNTFEVQNKTQFKESAEINILNSKNKKWPLTLAWENQDWKSLSILLRETSVVHSYQMHSIYDHFNAQNLNSIDVNNKVYRKLYLALSENPIIRIPFHYQVILQNKLMNSALQPEFDFEQFCICLWTMHGPNLPENLWQHEIDKTKLKTIQKYQKRMNHPITSLFDGKYYFSIRVKFLFNFSQFRNLINAHVSNQLDNDQSNLKLATTFDHKVIEKYLAHFKIPSNLKCNKYLLEKLHEIIVEEQEMEYLNRPQYISQLDSLVERIGLDQNRDKYFCLSRKTLDPAISEMTQEYQIHETDRELKLNVMIPEEVEAVKAIKLHVNNLDKKSALVLTINHQYAKYHQVICEPGNNYDFQYSFENSKLPTCYDSRDLQKKQNIRNLLKSIICDVKSGDSLEFTVGGPPSDNKRTFDPIKITLVYYKRVQYE